LELYKHDMQNTWKILKQAMNLLNNRSDITKIKHDGKVVEDPVNIVLIFAIYTLLRLVKPLPTIFNSLITPFTDLFRSRKSKIYIFVCPNTQK